MSKETKNKGSEKMLEELDKLFDEEKKEVSKTALRVFILKKIAEAQQDRDKELKRKIGALRQYLNERTSKELITNEEIETFLLN